MTGWELRRTLMIARRQGWAHCKSKDEMEQFINTLPDAKKFKFRLLHDGWNLEYYGECRRYPV